MARKTEKPPTTITIGEDTYAIRPPRSFAEREDVADLWSEIGGAGAGVRGRRVIGAVIGLCVPEVAKAAGAKFTGADPYGFGRTVYDYLHEAGVGSDAITAVGIAGYRACIDALIPRAPEVKEAEDFTGPSVAPST